MSEGINLDFVEVVRQGHQLSISHGPHAYLYASQLAKEAAAEGNGDEALFWQAVAASLTPRDNSGDAL